MKSTATCSTTINSPSINPIQTQSALFWRSNISSLDTHHHNNNTKVSQLTIVTHQRQDNIDKNFITYRRPNPFSLTLFWFSLVIMTIQQQLQYGLALTSSSSSLNSISFKKQQQQNNKNNNKRQHLILIGGGHAHVQVIKALNQQSRPKHVDVTLIDIQASASYSGMVPGCITGNSYTPEDTLLQLKPLAKWSTITFLQDMVTDIDFEKNHVYLKNNHTHTHITHYHNDKDNNHGDDTSKRYYYLPFDVISIDIGSTSRGLQQTIGAQQYTLPTRPISELVTRFEIACQEWIHKIHHQQSQQQSQQSQQSQQASSFTLSSSSSSSSSSSKKNLKNDSTTTEKKKENETPPSSSSSSSISSPHIVVIGGGAAGIELSMSVMGRFQSILKTIQNDDDKDYTSSRSSTTATSTTTTMIPPRPVPPVQVTLLNSGSELLPDETSMNRNALLQILKDRGITVRHNVNVQQVQKHCVIIGPSLSSTSKSTSTSTSSSTVGQNKEKEEMELKEENNKSKVTTTTKIPFTHCIWATGAGAHDLAYHLGQNRGLSISNHGWIQVNQYLQSISHPNVFAAGDCCTMMAFENEDNDGNDEVPSLPRRRMRKSPPKAGVYAVRAGPVLVQNLMAYLDHQYQIQQQQEHYEDDNEQEEDEDEEKTNKEQLSVPTSSSSSSSTSSPSSSLKLVPYIPQDDFLKLLVCGDGTALGFRFGFPIHGKWVWQLKDAIDQKFMNLFKIEYLPILEDVGDVVDDDVDDNGKKKKKKKKKSYDISQYDATHGTRPPPPSPNKAAIYLQRTDDDVDYEKAWNILRDMAENETYQKQVLEHIIMVQSVPT